VIASVDVRQVSSHITAHLLCEGNLQVDTRPPSTVKFMSAPGLLCFSLGSYSKVNELWAPPNGDANVYVGPLWLRSAAVAISVQMTRHTVAQ
jgi:hypothetical protein